MAELKPDFYDSMKCQNCDAPVLVSDESCQSCGAKLLHRRVVIGAPKAGDFALTSEEPPSEFEEPAEGDTSEISARAEAALRLYEATIRTERNPALRWGGFFRRAGAFIIDVLMIALLSALMGAMGYIGYKVGLAAHNRTISWTNAAPLMSLLTMAWVALATAYFVVFHGMEGKTIGKWLFGLRVVGAERQPISYRRALLRWIGWLGFGCASVGLSFLWILWNREKRAWHDYLARTWVVRE